MGLLDRLLRRQPLPEGTSDIRDSTPTGGSEKIKLLFVCGKSGTRSPQYEAAERLAVERAINARRNRLFVGQKVRTVTAPHVPDSGDVTGFVRTLQMSQQIGLLAYRAESCVVNGFPFLVIEMF